MAKIAYIKDLYENEGKSLRGIAEEVKVNFRTAKKYALQEDWNQSEESQFKAENYPILGEYIAVINEWLENDEREPRKQRHTVKRIYDRLCKEKGYTGSYPTVRRYVSQKKEQMRKYKESFLPLKHPLASVQVDFGKFKYYDISGDERKGFALIISFPNSNAGWMQVFKSENQECLLEGMKRIFEHIGGVPTHARCDNMTTAVAQVLEGTERIISDGFYRFMLHHRFTASFCTPAKGNEKGNVENKVGYTRRNMLVPVPTIADFEEFNEEILRLCDEDHERKHYQNDKKISELWAEEKKHLKALPKYEYEVFKYENLRVGKNGYIGVDAAKYPLSPELHGKSVQAKIWFDRVEIFYDHEKISSFERSYDKKEILGDWRTYIPALIEKPGATEHTKFFEQMPKLWQQYLKTAGSKERKSALTLLLEIVRDGNECICDDVLEMAGQNGSFEIDNIRQCYTWLAKPENRPNPLDLSANPPIINYQPDLSVYDILTGGAAV